jgi:hypothetical protein
MICGSKKRGSFFFGEKMKTLESQRALYLKTVEAAGNAEVLEVVLGLEKKLSSLPKDACKEAFSKQYIRTGSFSTTFNVCITTPVYCSDANHARVKEYFEQRNPNASVWCDKGRKFGAGDSCQARIKPESLFQ